MSVPKNKNEKPLFGNLRSPIGLTWYVAANKWHDTSWGLLLTTVPQGLGASSALPLWVRLAFYLHVVFRKLKHFSATRAGIVSLLFQSFKIKICRNITNKFWQPHLVCLCSVLRYESFRRIACYFAVVGAFVYRHLLLHFSCFPCPQSFFTLPRWSFANKCKKATNLVRRKGQVDFRIRKSGRNHNLNLWN